MTSSDDLEAQIEALIKEIDDDERSHYPSATTDENAVLALIQCNMEGKMDGLKECLKLAKAHLDRDRKMKAELAKQAEWLECCKHSMTNGDIWFSSAVQNTIDKLRQMAALEAADSSPAGEAADSKTEERK